MLTWLLLFLCLDESVKRDLFIKKFHDYQRKAEMYYVYHSIQRFTVCWHVTMN